MSTQWSNDEEHSAFGRKGLNVIVGDIVDTFGLYRLFLPPLEIEGTMINTGDIFFGDVVGVCIVPHEVDVDIFNGVTEKARGEKTVRKAIEQGMSAKEAFEKYGIL